MTFDELKAKATSMIDFQDLLAQEFKYKPLANDLRIKCQSFYRQNLPAGFQLDGDITAIYSKNGDLICSGYDRIVIGDYGAFIEYSQEQANTDIYMIEPGQEYRVYDRRYKDNVKYNWLTIDATDIKIYQQKKRVAYADYMPGKYYISPHEELILGYGVNAASPYAGEIRLTFSRIPAHCGECPLYIGNTYIDDEPTWGSGIHHYCPFGADLYGCLVSRPDNCPIKIK